MVEIIDGARLDKDGVLYCPHCNGRLVFANLDFWQNTAMMTYIGVRAKCKCSDEWTFKYDIRRNK